LKPFQAVFTILPTTQGERIALVVVLGIAVLGLL